jgi:hypothetical protein
MKFVETICKRCNYNDWLHQLDVQHHICNNCKEQHTTVLCSKHFAGIDQRFVRAASYFLKTDQKKLAIMFEKIYFEGKQDQNEAMAKKLEGSIHMFSGNHIPLVKTIIEIIRNPLPDAMTEGIKPEIPTFPPPRIDTVGRLFKKKS